MSATLSTALAEGRAGERWSSGRTGFGDGGFAGPLDRGALAILDHAAKWDHAEPGWADRDRIVLPRGAGEALGERIDHAPPQAGGALASAVGLALAERLLAARFGRSLVDHRCWAVTETGDLLAGLGHEAAGLAGALRLERLAVLCLTASGCEAPKEVARRFAAQGWAVKWAAEAEPGSLEAALSFAQRARKPTLILCQALSGPRFVGAADCDIRPRRAAAQRRTWLRRLARHPRREAFRRGWHGGVEPPREAITALADLLLADPSAWRVLAWLAALPELTCCVAGLGTLARQGEQKDGPLDCGQRIQGLAAALLGLNLHGGLTPCAIAPLDAADLLLPALRVCAASGSRTILVLLEGDDAGRFEHLAGLRALPGVFVMRPADALEAVACLDRALRGGIAAYAIVLPPRLAPGLSACGEAPAARGGYLVADAPGRRDVTLVASGAELAVALAARDVLAEEGIGTAVVSLPCWEAFALQDEAYRAETLGTAPRIGIEAGGGFGWERWLGRDGRFAGASLEAARAAARRLVNLGATPRPDPN